MSEVKWDDEYRTYNRKYDYRRIERDYETKTILNVTGEDSADKTRWWYRVRDR